MREKLAPYHFLVVTMSFAGKGTLDQLGHGKWYQSKSIQGVMDLRSGTTSIQVEDQQGEKVVEERSRRTTKQQVIKAKKNCGSSRDMLHEMEACIAKMEIAMGNV